MWAYRLPPADPFGLLIPLAKARAAQGEIDRDIENVKLLSRALGWDGTMVEPIRCFILPGPDNFMLGYLLVQGTGSQRYVISPVPLAFMDDMIDWDARTSIEEVQRTRAVISGQAAVERPPIKAADWGVSSKGNMFTQINGANVTIFPMKDGSGFKGIISAPRTERKVFTQSFRSEHEAAQFIMANFYDLVKKWGAPNADYDNPFAGIDFSAGEDDPDIPF